MEQDNKDLTYEDIKPGVRSFRTEEISKVEVGNGRFHRECRGYNMIETPTLGEIEITKWTQIALEVIKRNGDEKLLDAIIEHVSKHCPWIKNEKEKLTYAVQCLLCKAYEKWDERKEFVI